LTVLVLRVQGALAEAVEDDDGFMILPESLTSQRSPEMEVCLLASHRRL
jgi:hypothetical protein